MLAISSVTRSDKVGKSRVGIAWDLQKDVVGYVKRYQREHYFPVLKHGDRREERLRAFSKGAIVATRTNTYLAPKA